MRATIEMPGEVALEDELETLITRRPTHVLIATDGRPAADAAIVVGRSIAQRDGERYMLVAVEPLERDDEDRVGTIQQQDLPLRLALQRARTTDGSDSSWPLSIAYGSPGSTIADLGSYSRPRVIVMGLHPHSRTDRWLKRETVLQVMRRATCPVLAIDSNRRTIPRRTLLAIDFSPSSIEAAREAIGVIAETGPVYLTHVVPRVHVPFNGEPRASYEPDIAQKLDAVRKALAIPTHVTTRLVVLRGDPATELLAFAEQEGIELITTGSRGFSALRGAVIGAVPTALVRAAKCSMLVAPPLCEA